MTFNKYPTMQARSPVHHYFSGILSWLYRAFDAVATWVTQLSWWKFFLFAALTLIAGAILQEELFSRPAEEEARAERWAQAVELLRQGRVDATINDKLTFLDYETTNSPTGLKIAAETDDAGEQAFAFTKDKEALVTAVDGALDELRADGTLAEISKKYFGEDVSP
jgi:ABC-type amino acid transport substrate-binding protein